MKLCEHELYREDVRRAAALPLPWEKLKNTSVFLSGATGLLGSFFVDVLMEKNRKEGLYCKVVALTRNTEKARERFADCADSPGFCLVPGDVTQPISEETIGDVGYVLHMASHTHPKEYATDPIGTITTNIYGLKNMLDFAEKHRARRFAFSSSCEIYGENRGDAECFPEDYCGYIDCNTLRAGYTESKRCGEALCQAYISQKKMDIVIPRFTRSYGPTLLRTDTKAMSQFLHKAVAGEDIVLKSAGTQYFSYSYMADAVAGLFTVLLCGECGEAYNIADAKSDIRLKDLAKMIAEAVGRKVIFEIPDATESAGYSQATKARLSGEKLKKLGWEMQYDIEQGVVRTIEILRGLSEIR
jgi:UDP-glucuronate decarboxylase